MKRIPTDKWCFSDNGECFHSEGYDRKEDAIEDCLLNYEHGYIGQITKVEFEENDITYDETENRLVEVLYDEVGSAADGWKMTDEQETELSGILAKEVIRYINEHDLQPKCFSVVNIEEVER